MKKTFLVVLLLLSCVFIFAQIDPWLWAKKAGGTNNDYGYVLRQMPVEITMLPVILKVILLLVLPSGISLFLAQVIAQILTSLLSRFIFLIIQRVYLQQKKLIVFQLLYTVEMQIEVLLIFFHLFHIRVLPIKSLSLSQITVSQTGQ